jgi:transposase
MTKYREILRLASLGNLSQQEIADSSGVSKKTVNKVLKRGRELNISWPLAPDQTDVVLDRIMFPKTGTQTEYSGKKMPDFDYVRKELLRNGVTQKLLWNEYVEECRQSDNDPLMYSQYCIYLQQDAEKHRATMHIPRKPGEQVEVDWAGDTTHIIDRDTGEEIDMYVFVGAMSYNTYAYAEAFPDEKQASWTKAHVHMFSYLGGVPKIVVPDNTKTAVLHNKGAWDSHEVNPAYQEMAEYYNIAILPARVRAPKDKPVAEGSVARISTWITASLRNEQFFSIGELNTAIRRKLEEYNKRPFQKKEGSRLGLFRDEELPLLAPLPAAPFELATWKHATVQYNYHIAVDGMLYSVPYNYIHKEVDVRVTDSVIEIFYEHERIASHKHLYGRKSQYSTVKSHMPEGHQQYLEWDGNRVRQWGERVGINTYKVVDLILTSRPVEQQSYRSCMGLLKLAGKYSASQLEAACSQALSYTAVPSYKVVRDILATDSTSMTTGSTASTKPASGGITRGADYYRR